MDTDTVVAHHPQVVYRDLAPGEGGVLLHLETAAYHGVNDFGAKVWALVDGRRTLGDISRELRAATPDAPPELESDVAEFLSDLLERDLLR